MRAKSALDTSVTAAGTMVRVSGSLRDELDRGLPQREIVVFFSKERRHRRHPDASETLYTDRRGGFSTQRELEPGTWHVSVMFEETEHVTASRIVKSLEVEPAPVDLRTQIPRLVIGQVPSVPVRVRASVAGVGLQAKAEVLVNDVYAGETRLDQFGRGTVDVAGSLSPGLNEVRVRIPEGRHRDVVEEVGELRVSAEVDATASFQEVVERLQRGLAVEGRLTDERGPLPGVRVAVKIRREDQGEPSEESEQAEQMSQLPGSSARGDEQARYERFVTTDEQGRFRAFYSGDKLEDGIWHAQTAIVPELGAEIAVPTAPVELDRTTSRWILNALGLLGLIGGLALLLQRFWQVIETQLQRRRHERESEERAEMALKDTEALSPHSLGVDEKPVDTAPDNTRLSGMVWDIWKDRPVADAELVVWRDGERVRTEHATGQASPRAGIFIIDGLTAGAYELEVRARGFMPGKLSFRLPHKGRLSNVRLDLVAVPLKIRRLYQSLVETLDGQDLWGRLSPREIEAALLEVTDEATQDTGSPARRAFLRSLEHKLAQAGDTLSGEELVSMMTSVVEETYFSGRTFDTSVWELARDIALQLRDRQGEGAS
ncbi:hypothetical protein FIV42_27465 [Persicimonas caeni]|uniref:Carboxypeptidase regulatory-like domain-containing protein n=1 Tax=Persicimonas caeni TaxID=2292766 RepID=A0A4Y6Q1L2_PERCE|nr:hypothetical protein [Persicimonas caeni]QDG54349.1 hypothetical protein FIV42_27465 [Persicimonas caeni]QED35570.1 hypothetical protein FRD00_27460 [Persicimonas caeni]